MKLAILMGSPRKHGNTAQLLQPFCEELTAQGCDYSLTWLYDKSIEPCHACRACQSDWTSFACAFHDDMYEIAETILASDMIVLACPIYSWYCTAPMKAMLDRLVYGFNKYYGDEVGPSLWAGKKVAIITTCGYKPEKGADLFEAGVQRYCKHSKLTYVAMYAERHLGYQSVFMDDEKAKRARAFAKKLAAERL